MEVRQPASSSGLRSPHAHLAPMMASASAPPTTGKDVKLQLTHTGLNQSWQLTANGTDPQGQPAHFVVLQSRPTAQTLTVLDNRGTRKLWAARVRRASLAWSSTGQTYEVPIENGSVNASVFKQMRTNQDDLNGLVVYDPAFTNTAVCRSAICFIDGDRGILRYRGYSIEELAEKADFLEVAYLLINGELPNRVMRHTAIHNNLTQLMKSFNYDAHPMGMFISAIAGMSTFHPEANPSLQDPDVYLKNELVKNIQIYRLLGKAATVAACAYRHRIGRPYNEPQRTMTYTENFLYMLDHLSEESYKPNPVLVRALNIMFILHADHELNCSTAAMRHISSSQVDPYSAVAGAASALYGPLHGGACEIGSADRVPQFIEGVKKRERKLMGFGHRVYKNYDPRARIIKQTAYEVFKVCGREPLIDIAIALENAALQDPYFVERKLYPNVDFYSGLIYKCMAHNDLVMKKDGPGVFRTWVHGASLAMGFPTDFFPVLFAIPRVAGWLAHWNESLLEKGGKIWRPRQIYTGSDKRAYVPVDYRTTTSQPTMERYINSFSKRSRVASYSGKKPSDNLQSNL